MEPIKSTLKKWMQDNKNFKENYLSIKQQVLHDPEIAEFLALHPQLTENEIDKNLIKLYEYTTQSKQCEKCASFGKCINMIQGYSPILKADNNELHLTYEKCHSRVAYEKQKEQENLINSLYMPKDILHANLDSLDIDDTRRQIVRELMLFLKQAQTELPAKGFYFSGPFGVGKTYLLGAIANELKKLHISSMLIYMPEFVREMKGSIKDDSINRKIDYFKKTEVLMLDDIGAETQSAWFRDEILGSILQYRMMERLPVFFTSNYSLEQLEEQLAISNRGGVEKVKAGRIIERIKQVSKEFLMYGENRRN
ncbi:primosomal protein DnaI [Virgibacillus dakarensis]|uniref:Primosomal protein DnaI n=1 Tax=Lentibacillus populi TaxID=1827502 RepID=A0A9W5TUR1_9BACI|nr:MULTISPECIES: primosomal protein DnaI [Bacillaceae]MBT2218587.1 primosomal protein DnaI [Virgibacillus dakarensis]MTW84270.1 primosomal protein DnaI [Virgibacillus dakarensis]GGB27723.1 primosomal protein DnaI [Lentibacillus populi]